MKIYHSNSITPRLRKELCIRPWSVDVYTSLVVRDICSDIQQRGDEALTEYTKRFDNVDISEFRVTPSEFAEADKSLSDALRTALETAAQNIRLFHAAQIKHEQRIETIPGVICWRERRPIERVGLYVPAGSAPLPSTVLMLGIPALLAGCSRIILCSPPKANGSIDPVVLAAVEMVGISEVYKIGGTQAIAAMAYGTQSIPKVDKIFGPGNRYVTAAKQFVSSDHNGAAIDLLAGPSELLIIADETADPTIVAADLLSQAEHDRHSQVVLVTDSELLAYKVETELKTLLADLPRNKIAAKALEASFIYVTNSLDEAVEFSNEYAPEHLILNVAAPEKIVPSIQNAGSTFLGQFSPVTAGDYASGTNHTLPTGGTARWFSGVSVESFQKTLTFQAISREGLQTLAPTLKTLAEAEGLEAHRRAVLAREVII